MSLVMWAWLCWVGLCIRCVSAVWTGIDGIALGVGMRAWWIIAVKYVGNSIHFLRAFLGGRKLEGREHPECICEAGFDGELGQMVFDNIVLGHPGGESSEHAVIVWVYKFFNSDVKVSN